MKYQYQFTVLTTTYNRASTLHRAYESLRSQTYRNFEWLIIDDGSTDNTRELVADWRKKANFPLRYFWQENQGQKIAYNQGVKEAQGELVLAVDSDDACVPNTLECFKKHWDAIPEAKKNQFSAVTCLCVDQRGNLVGDKFPEDVTDSDSLEIRYKYKVRGEHRGFHRTDVVKQYPHPAVKKNVPTFITWSTIASEYKTRYINEKLYIMYVQEEGRNDRLSKSPPARFPVGHALLHEVILNTHLKWFRYAPLDFFKSAVHYVRFSFHAGFGIVNQFEKLKPAGAIGLWLVMFPMGGLVYIYDKMKYRGQ